MPTDGDAGLHQRIELQVILNLELYVINLIFIRLPNTAHSADILMTLSVAIIAKLLINLKHVMK
jgi:hypothetical protein